MDDRTRSLDTNSSDQAPDESVASNWEQVRQSMDDLAAERREEGEEALVIHPGHVAALGDTESVDAEFDVLVPSNEYTDLLDWFESGTEFDAFEVYKRSIEGVMYTVVVASDSGRGRSLIVPIHYDHTERSALVASAEAAEAVRLGLHPLSEDGVRLTFDPGAFFEMPEE